MKRAATRTPLMRTRPLTVWLSDPVVRKQNAGVVRFADLKGPPLAEEEDEKKRGKGAPRKWKLPEIIRYERRYPGRRCAETSTKLAADIRAYAATASAELQQPLVTWVQGLADAVEAGDAATAGWCALEALEELQALAECYVLPHAILGRKRRAGGAHRGADVKNTRPAD
jgi:hypothetical protein